MFELSSLPHLHPRFFPAIIIGNTSLTVRCNGFFNSSSTSTIDSDSQITLESGPNTVTQYSIIEFLVRFIGCLCRPFCVLYLHGVEYKCTV